MGLLSRNPGNKIAREAEILNKLGLHARPCAKFVKLANTFRSEVWVGKDSDTVNGKSIMGLMMLAAGIGSRLMITCEGPDAEKALEALEKLILSKFDED
jgi:phosphocarrier protein